MSRGGSIRLLVALVALSPGCGQEAEISDTASDAAAAQHEEAAEPDSTLEDRLAFLGSVAFEDTGVFPHGEHREVECASCHGDVPGHDPHESVACVECHGAPEGYRALPVRSEAECLACHHERAESLGCDQCHGEEAVGERTILARLETSVWEGVREREMLFPHEIHEDQECSSCHEELPTYAPDLSCRSCHEEHHEPDAACATCHVSAVGEHHDNEVHAGCGGAGCHRDPVTEALPWNRSLCLTCHQEQADHETQEVCSACHFLNDVGPAVGPAAGGPTREESG